MTSEFQRNRHRYNPARGGHAPGHLRDLLLEAFDEAVDRPWWEHLKITFYDSKQQNSWTRTSPMGRARWVLGQLWNCTDVVPGYMCDNHDFPRGTTYAQVVRRLRKEIED
jgi:hypothetical protein